ncbi:MAG: hypothetical protein PF482_18865, partial [Desulfobacteraceae bacterium]|nr:hypothetical protein [Desulfobacteraceae bacterium]
LTGSSLRGALAAKYTRSGGSPEDKIFQLLFISHPVNFTNLLPINNAAGISRVLPLTSVSCKRSPGFSQEDKHGVSDTLVYKFAQRNRLKTDNNSLCSVAECKNDINAFSGFWNGNIDSPQEIKTSIRFQRHTGIDRTTGTVAYQRFFITQEMADFHKNPVSGKYVQQWLSGSIYINDEQIEALAPLLSGPVFAGASRTRGRGEIELSIEAEETTAHLPDVVDWDRKFKNRIKTIAMNEVPSDLSAGLYFSITLESDAILIDRFLRPSAEISFPFDNIVPVLKVARSQVIRGWQSAWGLSKPDDISLSMGSVYLLRYMGNDMEGLQEVLSNTAINGIGLRREEGFGRISICDPLHIQEEVI